MLGVLEITISLSRQAVEVFAIHFLPCCAIVDRQQGTDMQIIEQFFAGKSTNEDLNEDAIAVTDDFIALMDGATNRAGSTLEGKTLGRFAAETVADAVATLSPDMTAREAVDQLTDILAARTAAAAQAENRNLAEDWSAPSTTVLIYSRARREIWRVADSSFLVDGGPANMRFFVQEKVWCDLRRVLLQVQMVRGHTVEDLLQHDTSWEVLTGLIAQSKVFMNSDHAMAHPYGYGVINGTPVPDRYVEVFDAAEAREIVFASDGYPEPLPTLAASEAALARVLAEDPLMYKIFPQTKGVRAGNRSYDDRSYIRFQVK